MNRFILALLLFIPFSQAFCTEDGKVRQEIMLEKGWRFIKGDYPQAERSTFDDSKWQEVDIPHDWAISGPFGRNYDLQKVTISQNLEKVASVKTGRTGGLPYIGVGWYRLHLTIPGFRKDEQTATLLFDGAMSEARVYVNEKEVCFWPNGYNSFYTDITDYLNADGQPNVVAVRLENRPESSRWYPGAGLYRNVHLIVTKKEHVPVWGTYITTPFVSSEFASVKIQTELTPAPNGKNVRIKTVIVDAEGKQVAAKDNSLAMDHGRPFEQNFIVNTPHLWSPESPYLYHASSEIYIGNQLIDRYTTRFGIRDIRLIADKGFYLNGKKRKFQGVCLHHDLGPLGTAVNKAAIRRQLTLLKNMGCDAIRTAHNMPAPELVELCDEMGFMVMAEPFDEWDQAKCINGYHRFFKDYAEKDMVNMLRHYRNNPSVVMWSIGNEVPTQCSPNGYQVAAFLQDICHREDPTRPVTCGMDQVSCVLDNGFAALLDVPGFNYRVHRYKEAYKRLPQNLVLGSETSSTVSSRGVYKFPVEKKADAKYDDHQCSSYDLEYCSWSNVPDEDFAVAEDHDWDIGQFVWTGFDYLGEPSPYDTDGWPNHSSMFGIIDLAGIPKDRYFLYKSIWNTKEETLHILPHWNWKGREGQITPVFVYTSYPSAELFVNGKSYGKREKNDSTLQNRYRLMWMNVKYEPGVVKVVAYDQKGKAAAEETVRTAGKPYWLVLTADRTRLLSDGKDLAFINVKVTDRDGNPCPTDQRLVKFSVEGSGKFKATANGDPTSLDPFQINQMHLFNGQLTAIVQSGDNAGEIIFHAKAPGLKEGTIMLKTSEH